MCPTFLTNRNSAREPFQASTFEIGHRGATPVDEIANLAAVEIERGDFEAADALLKRGLAQQPDHPACQAYMAVCLAAMGRSDGSAESTARAVIEAHPEHPAGWFALGQVNLLAGRRGAAFQHFAQARELARRDASVRGQLNRSDPRQAPVFKGLPRNHFLNIICGRIRGMLNRKSN